MPETGPLTRSMDKQFEKLFAMMAEIKAGQEEIRAAQAELEQENGSWTRREAVGARRNAKFNTSWKRRDESTRRKSNWKYEK
ncbi:hypothetical protein AVEN_17640-1 [Araneus ventricosus]|uniref:Uncharacterized protein n=1 Tax=Araneus ventricosus TaxID=182803 RepID=A0A4Y2LEZ1_ARAVE|nr:hypothetical protein AVEN_17640-1 [Araneus ventricosus]